MGLKSKPKKGNEKKLNIPTSSAAKEVNDNDAGRALVGKIVGNKTIEFENKDISLADIRLNPDNEIFRQNDNGEDIEILAEDIKRNGLLHNLVVFPEQEDGKTVYVLLSGERRYRALMLLQEQDATWNAAKNCNVITTPLSHNEKKVILYSANLQVRGGFGDEMIRRKASAEFIECLQEEPYNMNQAEAKKALKEISSASGKMIDRDLRLENDLNKGLLKLLDDKKLKRSECDRLIKFEEKQQQELLSLYNRLFAINCVNEEDRDRIRNDTQQGLDDAWNGDSTEEREERLEQVLQSFETSVTALETKMAAEKPAETEKQAALEREIETAEKKGETKTFVQKTLQTLAGKIGKKIATPAYKRGLKKMSREQREEDIKTLTELIEKAAKLKELLETVK